MHLCEVYSYYYKERIHVISFKGLNYKNYYKQVVVTGVYFKISTLSVRLVSERKSFKDHPPTTITLSPRATARQSHIACSSTD